MEMKQLKIHGKPVAHAEEVVEFDADDLPAPGAGFEKFFASLNADQEQAISQQAFDADVLKAYGRKP